MDILHNKWRAQLRILARPQATAPAYYFSGARHHSSREQPPHTIPDGLRDMKGYKISVGHPGVERIVSK